MLNSSCIQRAKGGKRRLKLISVILFVIFSFALFIMNQQKLAQVIESPVKTESTRNHYCPMQIFPKRFSLLK
jgi:hypothetical protein